MDVAAVEREVERQVAAGTRPGLHISVEIGGETALDLRRGWADPDAGTPVADATVFYTFSAVKAVLAVATVQLADRGRLDLDDPVARHLEEFGQAGKGEITIRQLLSHRAGLRDPGDGPGARLAWYYHTPLERQVADIYASAPAWPPGTARGYHGLTLQPLLSELIRRVDGRPAPRYVADEVFAPLGIDRFWLGLPSEQDANVATVVDCTGRYPTPLIYNTERMRRWPCGGFTNATQFARFFRGVLDAVRGRSESLLSAELARTATFIHAAGTRDRGLGHDIPWALGLLVKPAHAQLPEFRRTGRGLTAEGMFGTRSTPGTFGHAGNIFGSTAFADPGRDLCCAVMTNALLDLKTATESMVALLDCVYAALD